MINRILNLFKRPKPIIAKEDLPAYDMNCPQWIEYRRKNNTGYDKSRKSGELEYIHEIKHRIHGHGFYIGEMVAITSESGDENNPELSAQNKEGIVFYIKNSEIR